MQEVILGAMPEVPLENKCFNVEPELWHLMNRGDSWSVLLLWIGLLRVKPVLALVMETDENHCCLYWLHAL